MKVVIRADASAKIGSGHVIRCRTLAQALRERGHELLFICRDLPGNLIDLLLGMDFRVAKLDGPQQDVEADAAQTLAAINGTVDWMVVDHYGLDAKWERTVRTACRHVMAFEDVATRVHDCDLLLDQNLSNSTMERYAGLLPPSTRQLLGPQWAQVQPAFSALRDASLTRRRQIDEPRRLLVFLGGGDVFHDMLSALEGVRVSQIRWSCIDVVVGIGCPCLDVLATRVEALPGARLHVQTAAMAQLMSEADVALTAGGSVSWEKCCMGLPSVVAVLADNQVGAVSALQASGAVISLGPHGANPRGYAEALKGLSGSVLSAMSYAAAQICDGYGASRVAVELEEGWT